MPVRRRPAVRARRPNGSRPGRTCAAAAGSRRSCRSPGSPRSETAGPGRPRGSRYRASRDRAWSRPSTAPSSISVRAGRRVACVDGGERSAEQENRGRDMGLSYRVSWRPAGQDRNSSRRGVAPVRQRRRKGLGRSRGHRPRPLSRDQPSGSWLSGHEIEVLVQSLFAQLTVGIWPGSRTALSGRQAGQLTRQVNEIVYRLADRAVQVGEGPAGDGRGDRGFSEQGVVPRLDARRSPRGWRGPPPRRLTCSYLPDPRRPNTTRRQHLDSSRHAGCQAACSWALAPRPPAGCRRRRRAGRSSPRSSPRPRIPVIKVAIPRRSPYGYQFADVGSRPFPTPAAGYGYVSSVLMSIRSVGVVPLIARAVRIPLGFHGGRAGDAERTVITE